MSPVGGYYSPKGRSSINDNSRWHESRYKDGVSNENYAISHTSNLSRRKDNYEAMNSSNANNRKANYYEEDINESRKGLLKLDIKDDPKHSLPKETVVYGIYGSILQNNGSKGNLYTDEFHKTADGGEYSLTKERFNDSDNSHFKIEDSSQKSMHTERSPRQYRRQTLNGCDTNNRNVCSKEFMRNNEDDCDKFSRVTPSRRNSDKGVNINDGYCMKPQGERSRITNNNYNERQDFRTNPQSNILEDASKTPSLNIGSTLNGFSGLKNSYLNEARSVNGHKMNDADSSSQVTSSQNYIEANHNDEEILPNKQEINSRNQGLTYSIDERLTNNGLNKSSRSRGSTRSPSLYRSGTLYQHDMHNDLHNSKDGESDRGEYDNFSSINRTKNYPFEITHLNPTPESHRRTSRLYRSSTINDNDSCQRNGISKFYNEHHNSDKFGNSTTHNKNSEDSNISLKVSPKPQSSIEKSNSFSHGSKMRDKLNSKREIHFNKNNDHMYLKEDNLQGKNTVYSTSRNLADEENIHYGYGYYSLNQNTIGSWRRGTVEIGNNISNNMVEDMVEEKRLEKDYKIGSSRRERNNSYRGLEDNLKNGSSRLSDPSKNHLQFLKSKYDDWNMTHYDDQSEQESNNRVQSVEDVNNKLGRHGVHESPNQLIAKKGSILYQSNSRTNKNVGNQYLDNSYQADRLDRRSMRDNQGYTKTKATTQRSLSQMDRNNVNNRSANKRLTESEGIYHKTFDKSKCARMHQLEDGIYDNATTKYPEATGYYSIHETSNNYAQRKYIDYGRSTDNYRQLSEHSMKQSDSTIFSRITSAISNAFLPKVDQNAGKIDDLIKENENRSDLVNQLQFLKEQIVGCSKMKKNVTSNCNKCYKSHRC